MKGDIRGKPFFVFKVFFSALLISISCSAYAEYYQVYQGGCMSDCCGCWTPPPTPCVTSLHFSSPRRVSDRGSGQVSEYEWVGDP